MTEQHCMECQALFNFIIDHGWDKCRIRAIKGDPDPTDKQIEEVDDAAAMYVNHINEMHLR